MTVRGTQPRHQRPSLLIRFPSASTRASKAAASAQRGRPPGCLFSQSPGEAGRTGPPRPGLREDATPRGGQSRAGRRAAGNMGRRPLLSASDADLQPEPDEVPRPQPEPDEVAPEAAQPREREEAWAWPWAWPARGPKGAGRSSRGGDGGQDSGGCCARYWGRRLRRRRGGLSPPRAAARCGLAMATEQRPFHLVVFGASGFTGQFVTEEVAREQVALEQSSRLPWAVAGRSKEKLQQVLEKAALKLGNAAAGWAGPGWTGLDPAGPGAGRRGMSSPLRVRLHRAGPAGGRGPDAWPGRAFVPPLNERKTK